MPPLEHADPLNARPDLERLTRDASAFEAAWLDSNSPPFRAASVVSAAPPPSDDETVAGYIAHHSLQSVDWRPANPTAFHPLARHANWNRLAPKGATKQHEAYLEGWVTRRCLPPSSADGLWYIEIWGEVLADFLCAAGEMKGRSGKLPALGRLGLMLYARHVAEMHAAQIDLVGTEPAQADAGWFERLLFQFVVQFYSMSTGGIAYPDRDKARVDFVLYYAGEATTRHRNPPVYSAPAAYFGNAHRGVTSAAARIAGHTSPAAFGDKGAGGALAPPFLAALHDSLLDGDRPRRYFRPRALAVWRDDWLLGAYAQQLYETIVSAPSGNREGEITAYKRKYLGLDASVDEKALENVPLPLVAPARWARARARHMRGNTVDAQLALLNLVTQNYVDPELESYLAYCWRASFAGMLAGALGFSNVGHQLHDEDVKRIVAADEAVLPFATDFATRAALGDLDGAYARLRGAPRSHRATFGALLIEYIGTALRVVPFDEKRAAAGDTAYKIVDPFATAAVRGFTGSEFYEKQAAAAAKADAERGLPGRGVPRRDLGSGVGSGLGSGLRDDLGSDLRSDLVSGLRFEPHGDLRSPLASFLALRNPAAWARVNEGIAQVREARVREALNAFLLVFSFVGGLNIISELLVLANVHAAGVITTNDARAPGALKHALVKLLNARREVDTAAKEIDRLGDFGVVQALASFHDVRQLGPLGNDFDTAAANNTEAVVKWFMGIYGDRRSDGFNDHVRTELRKIGEEFLTRFCSGTHSSGSRKPRLTQMAELANLDGPLDALTDSFIDAYLDALMLEETAVGTVDSNVVQALTSIHGKAKAVRNDRLMRTTALLYSRLDRRISHRRAVLEVPDALAFAASSIQRHLHERFAQYAVDAKSFEALREACATIAAQLNAYAGGNARDHAEPAARAVEGVHDYWPQRDLETLTRALANQETFGRALGLLTALVETTATIAQHRLFEADPAVGRDVASMYEYVNAAARGAVNAHHEVSTRRLQRHRRETEAAAAASTAAAPRAPTGDAVDVRRRVQELLATIDKDLGGIRGERLKLVGDYRGLLRPALAAAATRGDIRAEVSEAASRLPASDMRANVFRAPGDPAPPAPAHAPQLEAGAVGGKADYLERIAAAIPEYNFTETRKELADRANAVMNDAAAAPTNEGVRELADAVHACIASDVAGEADRRVEDNDKQLKLILANLDKLETRVATHLINAFRLDDHLVQIEKTTGQNTQAERAALQYIIATIEGALVHLADDKTKVASAIDALRQRSGSTLLGAGTGFAAQLLGLVLAPARLALHATGPIGPAVASFTTKIYDAVLDGIAAVGAIPWTHPTAWSFASKAFWFLVYIRRATTLGWTDIAKSIGTPIITKLFWMLTNTHPYMATGVLLTGLYVGQKWASEQLYGLLFDTATAYAIGTASILLVTPLIGTSIGNVFNPCGVLNLALAPLVAAGGDAASGAASSLVGGGITGALGGITVKVLSFFVGTLVSDEACTASYARATSADYGTSLEASKANRDWVRGAVAFFSHTQGLGGYKCPGDESKAQPYDIFGIRATAAAWYSWALGLARSVVPQLLKDDVTNFKPDDPDDKVREAFGRSLACTRDYVKAYTDSVAADFTSLNASGIALHVGSWVAIAGTAYFCGRAWVDLHGRWKQRVAAATAKADPYYADRITKFVKDTLPTGVQTVLGRDPFDRKARDDTYNEVKGAVKDAYKRAKEAYNKGYSWAKGMDDVAHDEAYYEAKAAYDATSNIYGAWVAYWNTPKPPAPEAADALSTSLVEWRPPPGEDVPSSVIIEEIGREPLDEPRASSRASSRVPPRA